MGIRHGLERAGESHLRTCVVPEARVRAVARLLNILSRYLAESAAHCLLGKNGTEPISVTSAKAFAQSHLSEHVKTRNAARAVHLSEQHFCRVFKTATGITFTDYVARCRIEKAKELLSSASLRITDVAFASGFQSIPHFNHTFKRYVGKSPSEYRTARSLPA
jgi:transcriptional regulator GlxA family with amidase domain